ncbi:hypothetical protein PSPO01_12390 [Paraphaeosphaeria sporulosa]
MVALGRWHLCSWSVSRDDTSPPPSPLSAPPILGQPRPSSPVQEAPDKPAGCRIRRVRYPTLPEVFPVRVGDTAAKVY